MADQLAEAFGIVNIHKTRGNGFNDLGVHGAQHSECARSHSNDSGIDVQDGGDNTSIGSLGNSVGNHSNQGGSSSPGVKCKISVITKEPMRCLSNGDIYDMEMNGNIPHNLARTDSYCERTSLNGFTIPEESELDQSQDTISEDIEKLSLPSSPRTPKAMGSRQNSQSNDPDFVSGASLSESSEHCCHQSDSQPESLTQIPNGQSTASKTSPQKLDPKNLDLSLGLRPIRVPGRKEHRTISECSESDEMPDRRRHRSQRAAATAKQSWLLRLFESKLFDMSIAITYLFNSKEPGVQTYIGKEMSMFSTQCAR